jgi:hypothetical protein
MKRRGTLVWIILGSITVVAALALLIKADDVRGLLAGEPFYKGHPASYWKKKVLQELYADRVPSPRPTFGDPPDASALPVLVRLLADEDDQVCFYTCNVLKQLGREAKVATPALVEMLRHPDVFHRRNAASALCLVQTADRDAIKALADALRDDDPFVNWHAAVALGRIGPEAKAAVPALIDLTKSDRANLSYMGPDGNDQFNRGCEKVGDAAKYALKNIDADAAKKAGIELEVPDRPLQ